MRISILSIFPESFDSFKDFPITERARKKGIVTLETVDIKKYAGGSFRKIDDSPYGGGPGMLIRVDTLKRALDAVRTPDSHVVLLSPKGKPYTQTKARELSCCKHLVLIAGHYEGVDARAEKYIDEAISIGDYILTGGELASMVIADSVIRLKEGTIRTSSTEDESFENSLLEYPQYTHPYEFDGMTVPEVLLTGNTRKIEEWKEVEAIKETIRHRPDLIVQGRSGRLEIQYGYTTLVRCEDASEGILLNSLKGVLPVPSVIFEEDGFLLLSKLKGRPLSHPSVLGNRNRLIKAAAAALKMLWNVDTSALGLKSGDGGVFSHGSFILDNIIVDSNGIAGFLNLSKAGIADKKRDILSCLESLHSYLDNSSYGDFEDSELLSLIYSNSYE